MDDVEVLPHVHIQYSKMDQTPEQSFVNRMINDSQYNIMINMLKKYMTPDKIQTTAAVLWDTRKHAVELAMTFPRAGPEFDREFLTWIEGTKYPNSVKEKFKRVFDNKDSMPEKKKRRCKDFNKAESYPEYKLYRPIKSTTDEKKTEIAPEFQAVNKCLFSDTTKFIKTVPVEERAEHLMKILDMTAEEFICTDFSSFEAHFIDVIMFIIELPFYLWVMSNNTDHAWELELELLLGARECVTKDFILYSMSRASGEMNTSSGNGWSNLILNTYVTRVKSATKFDANIEGDDGISTTKPPESRPTTQDFFDLGWTCKLDAHKTFSTASFCGIVADPTDKINVTDVRAYLCEFGWTKQQYVNANETTLKALIRAKGYSAVFQYHKCPIIDELGRYALRITDTFRVQQKFEKILRKSGFGDNQYKKEKFAELYARRKDNFPPRQDIPMATRQLVEDLYAVTIQEQLDLERYLREKQELSPIETTIQLPEIWRFNWDNYTTNDKNISVDPENELAQFKIWARQIPNITLNV